MTGSTSNNHHALHPRDDRETLSALFDGELAVDAMRFALKRLDHDAVWRNTCGRWQLIGDALRGEATIAAPPDFASGVMRMLAAGSQAARMALPVSETQAALPAQGISRRRWIGGAALAASVAMVAVLAIRPFSESSSSGPGAQMAAGVVTPNSALQAGGAVAPISIAPAIPTGNSPVPASAVAVSDAPQPTSGVHATRGARAIQRPVRSAVASAGGEAVTAMAAPATDHRPFHPPADDIVTRPWPRAVLPDNASAGALTVDFEAGSASPSFYPFEPRLPSQEPASTPQTTEPPH